MQQKGLHRLRLVGEDLLAQILDQVAVRAQALGEKRTHLSLAALPLQQQRGQLQAGDPALGAAEDRGERGGLQVPLQRQVQKGAGLGEIELQISGAQLAELATRSQPRQGQAWIGAARDEQVQLGWAVLHQLGDGVLERLKRDGVVVVQHQEELATGSAGQVARELCEDSREGEALQTMWRGEVRLDTGPKRGITGLEGGQQGGEEVLRVVLLSIEGEPDGGHPTLGEKLGQQGGFAEANRGTEQDEALRETLLEALHEAGAGHQPGRESRHVEPGGRERLSGHGSGRSGVPLHDWCRPVHRLLRRRRGDDLGGAHRRMSLLPWWKSGVGQDGIVLLRMQHPCDLLEPGKG